MLFAASAFEHVLDSMDWHLFESLHLHIPMIGSHSWPAGKGFGITKYSLLMFIAGGLILWIYLPLAKKIQTGEAPKGTWWNLFESVLTFIREELECPRG